MTDGSDATTVDAALRALELAEADETVNGLERLLLREREALILAHPGARRHDRRRAKVEFRGQVLEVRVPRVRMPDGTVARVPLYERLKPRSVDAAAYRTAGVSTRGVRRLAEATSGGETPKGASRSNVQRLQAKAAAERLAEINGRWLGDEHIVAVMIDGKAPGKKGLGQAVPDGTVAAQETVLVAVGITVDGRKLALGIEADVSENHRLVGRLVGGLARRGLKHRVMWGLDGSSALWKGVREHTLNEVQGRDREQEVDEPHVAQIQSCVLHFQRKLREYLPEDVHERVREQLYRAWREDDADVALTRIKALADQLHEMGYPPATRAILKGVEETVTVQRLGLSWEARRALRSTNSVESAMSIIGRQSRDVMRWMESDMRVQWTAWALYEAESRWSRVADPPDLLALGRRLAPGRFRSANLLTVMPPTLRADRAIVPAESHPDAHGFGREVVNASAVAKRLLPGERRRWLGAQATLARFGLQPDAPVTEEQLTLVFEGKHVRTGQSTIQPKHHVPAAAYGEPAPGPVVGVEILRWQLEVSEPVAAAWAGADPIQRAAMENAVLDTAHTALKRLTNNEKPGWDIAAAAVVRTLEPGEGTPPVLSAHGAAFASVRGRGQTASPVTKGALSRSRAREAADRAKESLNRSLFESTEARPRSTERADRSAPKPESVEAQRTEPPWHPRARGRSSGPAPPAAQLPARVDPVETHRELLAGKGRLAHVEGRVKELEETYAMKSDEWLIATRTLIGPPFAEFDRGGARMAQRIDADLAIAKDKLSAAQRGGDRKIVEMCRTSLDDVLRRKRALREAGRDPDSWMLRCADSAARALAAERMLEARGLRLDWRARDEHAAVARERRQEALAPHSATLGFETTAAIAKSAEWPAAWLQDRDDEWIVSVRGRPSPVEDLSRATREAPRSLSGQEREALIGQAGCWLALEGEAHARERYGREAGQRVESDVLASSPGLGAIGSERLAIEADAGQGLGM